MYSLEWLRADFTGVGSPLFVGVPRFSDSQPDPPDLNTLEPGISDGTEGIDTSAAPLLK
jgi:hypothetical protein